MSMLNNSLLLGADAGSASYTIARSLRFNSNDSAFCGRTFTSAGNRKKWTWAAWVKRSGLDSGTQYSLFGNNGNSNDTFGLIAFFGNNIIVGGFTINYLVTSAVYRDPGAWMHIVVAMDTTQATASNRLKLYVNGSEVTAFSTDNRSSISQNSDQGINQAVSHAIGRQDTGSGSSYFSGFLADVFFIDGQALDPSSFVEVSATTGQLIPKAYTGTFTGNSFWLKFADNSAATATTLGKDSSGLGNNWTPNNLSVTAGAGNDSLVDTPTSYGTDTGAGGEVRGNYATLNPLAKGSAITLANGNLDWSETAADAKVLGTIGMSSGKWYWEVTPTATNQLLGIATQAASLSTSPGYDAASWAYASTSGQKVTNSTGSSYGASYTTNDVIGFAFDADNGTLTFYKNGSSQGQAFSGLTSGPYFPAVGNSSTSGSANFGQRPWAYTPPANYRPLVDTLLPAPVVAKSSDYFQTVLYTGNGSTQTISGLGFSPDLVWIKGRNTSYSHMLFDTIRGATNYLYSNNTNAEASDNQTLTAFTSDGFSLGNNVVPNQSSATHVAWAFDAGSNTVSNTQGSITSQVRANASAGFSIVTYTGTRTSNGTDTIGHGLGVAPELILIKRRDGAADWHVKHKSLTSWQYALTLNSTGAQYQVNTTYGTMSAPTSAVFSTSYTTDQNVNGYTYVAYCFSPVVGYSAMGSWTGSGNADGPAIWTGFRPRFLLWKRTDSASDWTILDAARDTYNYAEKQLVPNLSQAEAVTGGGFIRIDFLSNGFKLRGTDSYMNASGGTYIYFAVAESPFAYSRAR